MGFDVERSAPLRPDDTATLGQPGSSGAMRQEPTASLDDSACEVVAGLLLRAASETGAALVIATHDARLKARIPLNVMAEPAS